MSYIFSEYSQPECSIADTYGPDSDNEFITDADYPAVPDYPPARGDLDALEQLRDRVECSEWWAPSVTLVSNTPIISAEEEGRIMLEKMDVFFAANPDATLVSFDDDGNAFNPGMAIVSELGELL